jgi:hypothetical protein
MLLDDGVVIECGEPSQVAAKYSRINREIISDEMDKHKPQSSPIKIKIENDSGSSAKSFKTGDKMLVRVTWPGELSSVLNVGVAIVKNSGEFMFGANTLGKKVSFKNTTSYQVELSLGPGKYYIMAGLFGETRDNVIEFLDKGPEFLIVKDDNDNSDGAVRLQHKWINE